MTYHTGKYPAKGMGKGTGADQPYPYPYPVNTCTRDPSRSALPVLLPSWDAPYVLLELVPLAIPTSEVIL